MQFYVDVLWWSDVTGFFGTWFTIDQHENGRKLIFNIFWKCVKFCCLIDLLGNLIFCGIQSVLGFLELYERKYPNCCLKNRRISRLYVFLVKFRTWSAQETQKRKTVKYFVTKPAQKYFRQNSCAHYHLNQHIIF